MKPIYKPKGAAKEYGDYAINIYSGCPHKCYYCFAPSVLHKDRVAFHSCVNPRKDIVNEVSKQIERDGITGELIHLCFTCDPYPTGYDSTPTREIIKLLKDSGNHVQILTKGRDANRDFDLLDENDWFGVTISGYRIADTEPNAETPFMRMVYLTEAKQRGIRTWVSCEPVIAAHDILHLLTSNSAPCVDKWKIGKLNYHHSDIDWSKFGHDVEQICKEHGYNYYIKDSLRSLMNNGVKQ